MLPDVNMCFPTLIYVERVTVASKTKEKKLITNETAMNTEYLLRAVVWIQLHLGKT